MFIHTSLPTQTVSIHSLPILISRSRSSPPAPISCYGAFRPRSFLFAPYRVKITHIQWLFRNGLAEPHTDLPQDPGGGSCLSLYRVVVDKTDDLEDYGEAIEFKVLEV